MVVLDDVDILSWLDEEESARPATASTSAHANTLTLSDASGTCFEVQREVLMTLMDKAINVVPSRDMVPVLTNFQFRVSENCLTIIGSSLEMAVSVSTDQVQTKVAGVEVFPARTLFNVVKESGAGNSVYIEVTNSGAVVVSGGFSVEIRMASGKDFPATDNLDAVVFHETDRAKFLEAVASVKYALPGREYSGQASMKMIAVKGGKFTACDGSRFQQVRIDGFSLNMQLPAFNIATLIKVLGSSDQKVLEIGETAHKLVFRVGKTIVFLNKLNDPYPNVEQLWLRPALANDQELRVGRQELITAIKQVKTIADAESNAIALLLEDNRIKIVAKSTNNSASAIIDCVWTNRPKTLVVNYIHLAEMLKAYTQPECRFLLGEDTKTYKAPILLRDDDTLAIATISQMLAYRANLTS